MIITGDDVDGISVLKAELAKKIEMNDLGPLQYFLGIKVAYSPRGYLLSSLSKYVADILSGLDLMIIRPWILPLRLMQHILLLMACLFQILHYTILMLGTWYRLLSLVLILLMLLMLLFSLLLLSLQFICQFFFIFCGIF